MQSSNDAIIRAMYIALRIDEGQLHKLVNDVEDVLNFDNKLDENFGDAWGKFMVDVSRTNLSEAEKIFFGALMFYNIASRYDSSNKFYLNTDMDVV